ncbi:Uncharacterised protein [Vibrio cholerae]|nr:Uncharacterised protein [Vibrio cholerae]
MKQAERANHPSGLPGLTPQILGQLKSPPTAKIRWLADVTARLTTDILNRLRQPQR